MYLECVIVCKDYGDFLEETLPQNLQFFDHLVVVTHPDDKKTKQVCRKYSVDYVETVVMHEDGDKFNKARAINLGLSHLKGLGWILHMDADIVLPYHFRNLLFRSKLRNWCLYGADRLNVYGYNRWSEIKHKKHTAFSENYFITPPAQVPMGARIIHKDYGWTPLGFFQLWSASMGRKYPLNQGTAEHTDVLFACQWPRHDRILLPEVLCYHLESTDGPTPMGANWQGRKTPPFKCDGHCHHPVCPPYKPKK